MKKVIGIIIGSLVLFGCTHSKTIESDGELTLPGENEKVLIGQSNDLGVDDLFGGGDKKDSSSKGNNSKDNNSNDQNNDTINKNEEEIFMNDVVLSTSKGDIKLKLYASDAEKTVANFSKKALSGYYEGLIFHRVEDWVVQGGDPDGNGTGGGEMATELNDLPFKEGSLGVARGGDINVSNDSQFFICTKKCDWLNGQYTNFGEVVEGMEIVKSLKVGDKILSIKEIVK